MSIDEFKPTYASKVLPFHIQVINCIINEINNVCNGTTDLSYYGQKKFYNKSKSKSESESDKELEEFETIDETIKRKKFKKGRKAKPDIDYSKLSPIGSDDSLINSFWIKKDNNYQGIIKSSNRKDEEQLIKDIIEGKRMFVATNNCYGGFNRSFLFNIIMFKLNKISPEKTSKSFKEYSNSMSHRTRWDLIIPILFLGEMASGLRSAIVLDEIKPCYANHTEIREYDGMESIRIMKKSYEHEKLVKVIQQIYNMDIPEVNLKLEEVKDIIS